MKKVNSIKVDKIWGYEKWIYSPVKGMETDINGNKTYRGPLIKIINANDDLSVQVHPDDELAKELEKQENGKTESWYIIESNPKSQIIVGLNDYDPAAIRKQLEEKTFRDNLLTIKVKPGDFINVPAGLVHGIGGGNKVLEVQQPSDTTYRYYDYDRLQNGEPRELHIDKAIKSQKNLSYKLDPIESEYETYSNLVGTQSYRNTPSILKKDSIIVDIKGEEAYEAKSGEKIDFPLYCVVSY